MSFLRQVLVECSCSVPVSGDKGCVFIRKWMAKITVATKSALAFGHLKARGKKRKQPKSFQNNKSKLKQQLPYCSWIPFADSTSSLPWAGKGWALGIRVNTEFQPLPTNTGHWWYMLHSRSPNTKHLFLTWSDTKVPTKGALIHTSWWGTGEEAWVVSVGKLPSVKAGALRAGWKTLSGKPTHTPPGAVAFSYQRVLIYLESKPPISCTCDCAIKMLIFVRHVMSRHVMSTLILFPLRPIIFSGSVGKACAVRLESTPQLTLPNCEVLAHYYASLSLRFPLSLKVGSCWKKESVLNQTKPEKNWWEEPGMYWRLWVRILLSSFQDVSFIIS